MAFLRFGYSASDEGRGNIASEFPRIHELGGQPSGFEIFRTVFPDPGIALPLGVVSVRSTILDSTTRASHRLAM